MILAIVTRLLLLCGIVGIIYIDVKSVHLTGGESLMIYWKEWLCVVGSIGAGVALYIINEDD